MIKDPVERSQRFSDLMWDMMDAGRDGRLDRAMFVRIAKELVRVQGDGFANNCVLAGYGKSFRAWKKVKNWARRRKVKPYLFLGP